MLGKSERFTIEGKMSWGPGWLKCIENVYEMKEIEKIR
jgi:hypothetical protein